MTLIYTLLFLAVVLGVLIYLALNHDGFKKLIGKYFYNWLYGLKWGLTDTNNYGYAPTVPRIDEAAGEEKYQAQLYWELAATIPEAEWKTLSVLEVGCGRGGGLRYLTSLLQPKQVTGLDFSQNAINFCNKRNRELDQRVHYVQGDAHELPFKRGEFDVVINVESSHIYQDQAKFFKEVFRVLKPGGRFLIADYRKHNEGMHTLRSEMTAPGFSVESERDISENVLQACQADEARRRKLIAVAPSFLSNYLNEFAMTTDSKEFKGFRETYQYFIIQAKKA